MELDGLERVQLDGFDRQDLLTLKHWFETVARRPETPLSKRELEIAVGIYDGLNMVPPDPVRENMEYWNSVNKQTR